MLYHLIYVSKAVSPLSGEALNYLLQQARRNNEADGITGMLLYVERHMMSQATGRFMQIIEGNETDIISLFEKIRNDPRHNQVTVLKQGNIYERSFERWLMGFKVMRWQEYVSQPGFLDLEELFSGDEVSLSPDVALDFMKTFYAM